MPKPPASERAQPLVKEKKKLDDIHGKFTYAVDRWKKIREARKEDMRHVSGDPWEPKEKLARLNAMRPVPACDEIGQYLNQVTNEVKQNPRALKFSPVGFGANDKTARFYGDKAREIEYRSKAQQHYGRAFQNMVEGSYGYVKVRTEFVTDIPAGPQDSHSAFNKRLVIDGCPDPDCVYPDPDFLDSTGRDWDWLFEIETVGRKDFRKSYPNAEIQNFSPELVKYAKGWITGAGENQKIQIASFWEIERSKRVLQAWQIRNPETGAEEIYELFTDADADLIKRAAKFGEKLDEREVDEPKVFQYRTNGVEILKKTPWVGRSIPYAAFFGKMLWLDLGTGPELMIMSMTRLARNPNMLLAYYLACEAEMIGMTPKVPWFVWKGSVDKKNAIKIQEANHKPVPFIEIDVTMNQAGGNGQPTPSLPQRVPFEPQIQAIEVAKESARRSIQAAMGLTPLPTSAQRRNEKSGVALRQIEDSGQRGSYHFIDSYDNGIERIGEILEDVIPKVHDTVGETPVLDNQKRPKNVFINSAQIEVPEGGQAPEVPEDAIPSIDGLHAVTIDVGPSFANERDQASDFVDTFVGSPIFTALPPQMALQILSLLVKLKNLGPIGEEIADILHPPEKEGQAQMVPAAKLQEVIQTGQQVIEALQQKLSEAEQEKAAKVTELQGRAAIAQQQDSTKLLIAMKQIDQKMAEAHLEANTDIRLQKMEEAMEMLKLHIANQNEAADRHVAVATHGATLEHDTAMQERQRATAQAEGREQREFQAREGQESRESAAEQAAEDRKIKAAAVKAKPKGAK